MGSEYYKGNGCRGSERGRMEEGRRSMGEEGGRGQQQGTVSGFKLRLTWLVQMLPLPGLSHVGDS